MKLLLAAIPAGLLIGAGLVLSGMASPPRVLAFLTLAPGWRADLAVVMAGALLVALPAFRWLERRAHPLLAAEFQRPPTQLVDLRLMGGAAVFGIGWGLAGYCPGPALVGAGLGTSGALVFLLAMLAGGAAAGRMR